MADRADGDEFDEFVERRYLALVRSALLLTADRQHAEDLVQTALYRTYTHFDRLSSPQAAEAYTRTTMLRLALRWRSRRWRAEIPSVELPDSAVDAADERLALGVDVCRALASLPAGQRAVLVLRYMDDMSEAQTAMALRCSVGTVKSRASRALATLRSTGLLADEVSGANHE